MLEENKTVELKDEELEKVNGGLTIMDVCKKCGRFEAIVSNGCHDYTNCKKYNNIALICSELQKAGFIAA